jgi:hypothetical protein
MQLMPSMGYDTVKEFYWNDLKNWHESALKTYKKIHGVK